MSAHPTLLLTGATGMVGRVLHRSGLSGFRAQLQFRSRRPDWLRRGERAVAVDFREVGSARRLVEATEPEVIVHLAALSSLGACASDPSLARRVNSETTRELAESAARSGAWLVFASTDQVFDGREPPYGEDSAPSPLSEYGRTKADAERAVRGACPDALIVRFPLILGASPGGAAGAVDMIRSAHVERRSVRLFEDEFRTPISALDLTRLLEFALRERPAGVVHAAGSERVDRLDLGRRIRDCFGFQSATLVAGRSAEMATRRPADVSLIRERAASEGWPRPQGLDESLRELARQEGGPARP